MILGGRLISLFSRISFKSFLVTGFFLLGEGEWEVDSLVLSLFFEGPLGPSKGVSEGRNLERIPLDATKRLCTSSKKTKVTCSGRNWCM